MLRIGMLIYPMMFDIDLVGPLTYMRRLGDADVFLVWKDRAPVVSDLGVSYAAGHSFEACPKELDILFVPGGLKGAIPAMQDGTILDFLADRGARAKYVTSVCTGSLLLGAAGLLKGYKAASYWMVRDLLPLFGAEPVTERVVIDRNRITGGGATAGLDFGLTLAAELRGEEHAKMLQLAIEYDPHPAFDAGAPERAPAAIVEHLRDMRAGELTAAREAALAAAERFGRD
ncbi:DJ-1/PfpI family protein [Methylocystis parvus]|uniref:DJ-1/PfpI family protein n=1 Tax=Methylocystis parvus TaxID=134 RepID=A0A6B8MBG8_9HYPH|nr:DJ-1/PfpI family protein [Methylocystis parvus]QGM98643.1 DJ-1/PfpI family protein [Methylocystis parvus]WBK01009.1 DJ-1/PfpI family protein [Methylocystis parvus OBBP]